MPDLPRLSAAELLDGYAARAFSPVEVVEALGERIAAVEPLLKAFITLTLDRAREEAREAERAWVRGKARPLEGIPLAVKDLFDTVGVRTTYGSPIFADHVPTADAEAVRLARAAGAIVVGKTSTHEFAWGITSYNPHFDSGRNPWAPDRVSGGSSGGSAVALATHMAPLALGSDTGGSIRAPAAFCGVVGLKPTYGLASAAGVFPLAPSLDHVGPMARTPADAALLLAVLAAGSAAGLPGERRAEVLKGLRGGVGGLRVGVSADLVRFEPAPDVQAVFDNAQTALRNLGAAVVEVDFREAAETLPAYDVIQRAEARRTHERLGLFPAWREEYGADVRGRLEGAAEVTLADYVEATAVRERVRAAFARLLREVDLLLTPVSAGPPVLRGQEEIVHTGRAVPFRDFVMSYTTPQNLVGLPACALRAGFDDLGLPVGIQLVGPPGGERAILRAVQALFEATEDVQRRWPALDAA